MDRRRLIRAGMLTGAATLAGCSRARILTPSTQQVERPTIQWRMATSWPTSLDIIYGGAETFCQRVSGLTGGRFTIIPFPSGELAPGLQVLDAVQSGSVECGHTVGFYYTDKNPAFAFSTSVPFGLTASQQNSWLFAGGGLELLRKLYAEFNIINFPAGNSGAQMGGWFAREITNLADLQGLKIRMTGLGAEVMRRLGADIQSFPASELLVAMQRGAIEGVEWIGPYDDEQLGLNTVADVYHYPGWWEPGTTFEVQVNLSAWQRLPSEYQQAISTAAYESYMLVHAGYDAANRLALQRLVEGGTKLVPFPNDLLEEAERVAFEFYEEQAAADATFREIYTQWKVFREEIYRWNRVNELSFFSFVAGRI